MEALKFEDTDEDKMDEEIEEESDYFHDLNQSKCMALYYLLY